MSIESYEEERKRLIEEANTQIVSMPPFTGEGLTNEQIRQRTDILIATFKLAFSEEHDDSEDEEDF